MGRGKVLSKFWREWFRSRDYREIDFMPLKGLSGLKRESLPELAFYSIFRS